MSKLQYLHNLAKLRSVELILVIGLFSTLIVWGSYTFWPLFISFIGLIEWCRQTPHSKKWFEDHLVNEARRLLWSSFAIFISISLILEIYHTGTIQIPEHLALFIIYPLIATTIANHRLTPFWFWIGVSAGAVAGCLFAIFQVYTTGERAYGLLNPITFGDTAVVLCAASFIGLAFLDFKQAENKNLRLLLLVGATCGMITSLLSGSKGGWLSLSTIIIFAVIKIIQSVNFRQKIILLILIGSILSATVLLVPKSLVHNRILSGWNGLVTWIETGKVTEGSVSMRLEFWAAGIEIFKENPLIGLGHTATNQFRIDLAKTPRYSPELTILKTFDNEYINRLANHGALGLLGTIVLFVLPFFAFYRFRKNENSSVKALGYLGMTLPVLYMEFGLSVSIFDTNIFRQVYVSWLITLLALIAVQQNSSMKSADLE